MFRLRRPTTDELTAWLSVCGDAAAVFTTEPTIPDPPPPGFRRICRRSRLGAGESLFRDACTALLQWKSFPHPWTAVEPHGAPVEAGRTVAAVVRTLGIWTIDPLRIIDVSEHMAGSIHRFGFTNATCGDHVMRGAERFEVSWDRHDDSVWYEVASYSRPRHLLVWLLAPYVRSQQRRFVRDSQFSLKQALAERQTGNEPTRGERADDRNV